MRPDSDIDLVVSFNGVGINDYADNYFDLKFRLEELLKRPVDLLEEQAIRNPYFRKEIEISQQVIYG
jgi:predicted nucleotidyltransferase